jgi:isopentenyldiphosphate isomerase
MIVERTTVVTRMTAEGSPAEGISTEHFDLIDQAGRLLGKRKPRSAVHRDGDWHRSMALWLVRPSGSMVVQRRSLCKDTYPGLFTATVSGHYAAGETLAQVLREAREEVGQVVSSSELLPIGRWLFDGRPGPALIDRELQDVFLWPSDLPLAAFLPDEREVLGLAEMPVEAFLGLVGGTLATVGARWLAAGAAREVPICLVPAALVPEPLYHVFVGRAAQDYISQAGNGGTRGLAVDG